MHDDEMENVCRHRRREHIHKARHSIDHCVSIGALSALPSSKWRSRPATCFISVARSRYVVKMSAGFMDPGILVRAKSPLLRRSWTHKSATARWRILPRPRRRQTPIAAVASVNISSLKTSPRSREMLCNPSALLAPLQIPPSSASPDERATVLWVELQCWSRWAPRLMHPPEVLRLVRKHPATSVSTKQES